MRQGHYSSSPLLPTLEQMLRAKGTDKQFREWVQRQKSCISGAWSEWLDTGEGRSLACHYRTAENSGTGCKPDYSAIPMTFDEHKLQHDVGQYAFRPREWWEAMVRKYQEEWLAS